MTRVFSSGEWLSNFGKPASLCVHPIGNHWNTHVLGQVTRCLGMMDEIDCLLWNYTTVQFDDASTGDGEWRRSGFRYTLFSLCVSFPSSVRCCSPPRGYSRHSTKKRKKKNTSTEKGESLHDRRGSCCSWRATKWERNQYITSSTLYLSLSLSLQSLSARWSLCRYTHSTDSLLLERNMCTWQTTPSPQSGGDFSLEICRLPINDSDVSI